jgi:putative endonuclease
MGEQNLIGKEGEEEARFYLIEHGYVILESNWHWRHYEIDIIATKDDELIVVEVKTRSTGYLVSPKDSIDQGKINRIVAAADAYVRKNEIDMPVRFDIITVIKGNGGSFKIDHIDNAFYAPVRRMY